MTGAYGKHNAVIDVFLESLTNNQNNCIKVRCFYNIIQIFSLSKRNIFCLPIIYKKTKITIKITLILKDLYESIFHCACI